MADRKRHFYRRRLCSQPLKHAAYRRRIDTEARSTGAVGGPAADLTDNVQRGQLRNAQRHELQRKDVCRNVNNDSKHEFEISSAHSYTELPGCRRKSMEQPAGGSNVARSLQTFKSKLKTHLFFCLILVIFLLGLLLYCKVTEVRCIFHFNLRMYV